MIKAFSSDRILDGIKAGDRIMLSKAITLLESQLDKHKDQAAEILSACLKRTGNSVRIAITGVPGAGKSTFIESLGCYLADKGSKVAVLAIDPSSVQSKGSILGDKTRMERLSNHPNAYVRPSPTGGSLGGVARKTRESIFLCEAAGYDVILVETVGVGQSEVAAHSMVDFFLLLLIAGAGDELQGIKRGIMELADAIVVNKADGENAKKAQLAKVELNRAVQFLPKRDDSWKTKVMTGSVLTGDSTETIWQTIGQYQELLKKKQLLQDRRSRQASYWLEESIKDELFSHFKNDEEIAQKWKELEQRVKEGDSSTFAAAREIVGLFRTA